MSTFLRRLVAQTSRQIIDLLYTTTFASSFELKADDVNFINTSQAHVDHNAIVFPETSEKEPIDWCIFILSSTDTQRHLQIYGLSERLTSGLSTGEFVTRAHQALLSRPVAPSGKIVFAQLIENGQMTRYDVLRVFACSVEARSLELSVVVLPAPSIWSAHVDFHSADRAKISVRMTN